MPDPVLWQAIDEVREEWSDHGSRGVVETRGSKGLKSAIPENFPYFHVEFGLNEGMCLLMDDPGRFRKDWGRSVVQGILEGDQGSGDEGVGQGPWSVDAQMRSVREFLRMWDSHDWTKLLD